MARNDFDEKINVIVEGAKLSRKQELRDKKVGENIKETQVIDEGELSTPSSYKESRTYTAVIVARFEYIGGNLPEREQLANDLGTTIIKWADQKSSHAVKNNEPIPELVSTEVYIN